MCTCSAGYISPTGLTNLTACSGTRKYAAWTVECTALLMTPSSMHARMCTTNTNHSLLGRHVQQQRLDGVHDVPCWQHQHRRRGHLRMPAGLCPVRLVRRHAHVQRYVDAWAGSNDVGGQTRVLTIVTCHAWGARG